MARKTEQLSISSIAAELGVSPSSVSRVINHRTGVGEETRRRVNALLKKYHFTVNYPAVHDWKIAIVLQGNCSNRYSDAVLEGVLNYLATHGVISERGGRSEREISGTLIFLGQHAKQPLLTILRDQQCSGVILINPAFFRPEFPSLAASGLPVMLVDEVTDVPGIGYIDNDSHSGSLNAVRRLIADGHRNIGYLRRGKSSNHEMRYRGYLDALTEGGIPFRSELTLNLTETPIPRERILLTLLQRAPQMTALLTTDDELAWHALHEAAQRKIEIPRQLSIIGFDDYEINQWWNPTVSSVRHPMARAGALAAEAIADYLRSGGSIPLPRRVLETTPVFRDSSGPCVC